ncbi:fluoride efflux transporter CrcB [Aliihoeflea aestuarii]|jgi:fluoride exporter|uniref:fluoride efflux transporter CrcB n=1 Tax=Aliihoeflea aestuarii TaxID=453840 RepID=UPI0020932E3C|nr:fluoride efflux transporter CrcB [Aliihoeflea aestuarii]MCO6390696.1 fluoride efflux transporter CrcB [Aliihoeflea aestuarii]
MTHLLIVAAGGALGAGLRHLVNLAALRWFGPGFPWGTLFVNIAGCLAMGVFVEMLARRFGASAELRLFIATGFLGGFTTFSAFSLDFALLYERGALLQAGIYVAGSVGLSIAAVFTGMWLARTLA